MRKPHRSPAAIRAVLLLLLLATGPALAHDVKVAVSGTELRIDTTGAAASFVLQADDVRIIPGADPRSESSALIVRSLDGDQSTGAIVLDRNLWTVGSEGTGAIYTYADPDGKRGGVTFVELRAGFLRVEAGAGFPLSPTGDESGFEVLFRIEGEWSCVEFAPDTATVSRHTDGVFEGSYALRPPTCEPEYCGNGVKELGESCDDGNMVDDDQCSNACELASCEDADAYDSTFEAIQSVVFDGYSCSNDACHGRAAEGELDLREGASYAQLFRAPAKATQMVRVEPGEPEVSFLYEKLAAKTLGTDQVSTTGTPMPSVVEGLTPEHLEAMYAWIRKGAPEDGVVEGTAELLGSCLPPDTPLKIDPPVLPEKGVQFQQTAYILEPEGEEELCMATYYDFTRTDLVPEEYQIDCEYGSANNPSGKCFVYHRELLLQDPQSHHSIIHLYTGNVPFTSENIELGGNSGFGPFTYKPNDRLDPKAGEPCDPFDVDPALGYNPDCSGRDAASVACIGWGPPGSQVSPAFSGSQEPYYEQEFADGVYSVLPMSGFVIWNSHAFNLTTETSTMAQYLNLDLAEAEDRHFQLNGIFDADDIFAMNVPPFETQEICGSFLLPRSDTLFPRLFRLSSHTHQWGVQFRIWGPPNVDCNTSFEPSDPTTPVCAPGPEERLMYYSTEYTDPVQLDFEPPMLFADADPDMRRFRYCSVYDNGSTEESPAVHAKSTSNSGFCFDPFFPPADTNRYCLAGPLRGEVCTGDAECDSAPGEGDGVCDEVCSVRGGVKTTDEMFIMLGSFFLDTSDEPAVIDPPGEGTGGPDMTPFAPNSSSASSFCGLVGLELLAVPAAARWLARRRRR